jgi:pimeloyl-ACP methyl ester carboxylesterase
VEAVKAAPRIRSAAAAAGRTFEEQLEFERAQGANLAGRDGGGASSQGRAAAQADVNDQQDVVIAGLVGGGSGGLTPLVFAAREGDIESARVLIDAGAAIGYIQDKVAEGTLASVIDPKRALREEADLRISILTTPETRAAAQAMIRQATSWKDRRPDWQANLAVTSLYRNVKVPSLIIWGEQDEILPCAMGFKIAAQMHQADLVCVPDTMHSPELERPTLICRLVREVDATGKPPELDPHAAMTHN